MRGEMWQVEHWRSVKVQPLSMYSPSCNVSGQLDVMGELIERDVTVVLGREDGI